MAVDWEQTQCLHCGAPLRTPRRVLKMGELYKGRPVVFCSKKCNVRFVNGQRLRDIEDRAKSILRRLSGESRG